MLQKIKGDTFLSPLIFLPLKLSYLLTYLIIFCPLKQHLGIYMYILLSFRTELAKPVLFLSTKNFCLLRENLSNTSANEKRFLYFSLYRIKVLHIEILSYNHNEPFQLLHNIIFYTQQVFVFLFVRDFCCNVHSENIAFFSFSSLEKF